MLDRKGRCGLWVMDVDVCMVGRMDYMVREYYRIRMNGLKQNIGS